MRRLVLLDTLGVILAGGERPEVRGSCANASRRPPAAGPRSMPGAGPRTTRTRRRCSTASPAARSNCAKGCASSPARPRCRSCPAVLAVGEQRRRPGREMLAAFILGYDVVGRLAAGFTPRPLAHQNGQVSLLAAAAAGARLCGLDAAGVSRAMRIADDPAVDAELHQRGRRRDGAQCCRRHERVCRGAGARAGAGRVHGARGCDRGGAGPAGRRRLHAGRDPRRARHALGDHPQLFPPLRLLQPDPSGARLPRRRPSPNCGRAPIRSSGSRSRPIVLRRSCATLTRPIISPRNIRCRTPPRRWWCAAAPASPRSTTRALDDPVIAALRQRVHIDGGPGDDRGGAAAAPGAGHRDAERRAAGDAFHARAIAAISLSPLPKPRCAASSASWPATVLTPEGAADVERAVDRVEEWASVRELSALLRQSARS